MDRAWSIIAALALFVLITVGLIDLYTFLETDSPWALFWSILLLGEAGFLSWLWHHSGT